MARKELSVEPRQVAGKKVKQLRRAGVLPANIYGHGLSSVAVQVSMEELEKTLRAAAANEVIDVKVAGERGARPVVVHHIQRHALTSSPLHADFYQVSLREKMRADVPLVVVGRSEAGGGRSAGAPGACRRTGPSSTTPTSSWSRSRRRAWWSRRKRRPRPRPRSRPRPLPKRRRPQNSPSRRSAGRPSPPRPLPRPPHPPAGAPAPGPCPAPCRCRPAEARPPGRAAPRRARRRPEPVEGSWRRQARGGWGGGGRVRAGPAPPRAAPPPAPGGGGGGGRGGGGGAWGVSSRWSRPAV